MTHAYDTHNHVIDWDDCVIHHYENNNGVLLRYEKHPYDDGLIFIDGVEIGVTPDTPFETVKKNIEPLFKSFLKVRNAAFERGRKLGDNEARAEIRKAIGVSR